jgi:hypothetical protein
MSLDTAKLSECREILPGKTMKVSFRLELWRSSTAKNIHLHLSMMLMGWREQERQFFSSGLA